MKGYRVDVVQYQSVDSPYIPKLTLTHSSGLAAPLPIPMIEGFIPYHSPLHPGCPVFTHMEQAYPLVPQGATSEILIMMPQGCIVLGAL